MSTSASYAATPVSAAVTISTANTERDGSGTITDVLSAGASGTRVDDIEIVAQGTTTAGVVRLFLFNGSAAFLWKEIMVTAKTPSVSVSVFSYSLQNLGLILESGWKLQASTHIAEAFNVCVTRAGDF